MLQTGDLNVLQQHKILKGSICFISQGVVWEHWVLRCKQRVLVAKGTDLKNKNRPLDYVNMADENLLSWSRTDVASRPRVTAGNKANSILIL